MSQPIQRYTNEYLAKRRLARFSLVVTGLYTAFVAFISGVISHYYDPSDKNLLINISAGMLAGGVVFLVVTFIFAMLALMVASIFAIALGDN